MNIINLKKWDSEPYCEIGQANPLRWMNLKQVGPDVFEPVSYWWKCKDFLNDAITAKHLKKEFSIYGFNSNPTKFFNEDQEGMYLLLKNVVPSFSHNMMCVNEYLLAEGFDAITHLKVDDNWLIYIPDIYLHNTLFISQVTLFIRLANVNKECSTLEELAKESPTDEANFSACMKKKLSEFPEELCEYIWYYDKTNNCKHGVPDQSFMTSNMHNCGVVSWGWV